MKPFWLLALLWPNTALAVTCRDVVFEATSYTVCDVAIDEDLRLFHSNEAGVFGSFRAVNDALVAKGETLLFAMNAGMFHSDLGPVGLYVEDFVQQKQVVTSDGPGNFGLLPNGVFCVSEQRFAVLESRKFAADPPACRMASQSGPMLVIDGDLHPRFKAGSDSVHIRNGVGVSLDGLQAVFAISNAPVNFHSFARLFRDELATPNALYFDGSVSRLFDKATGRHDAGFPLGPIVGVVGPLD